MAGEGKRLTYLAAGDDRGGTLSLTSFAFREATGSVSLSPVPLLPMEQPLSLTTHVQSCLPRLALLRRSEPQS